MRILLDECLPKKFKRELRGHSALTVADAGWRGLKNGALLQRAEEHFDVFLTTDKSFPYQQNLSSNRLSIIVLRVLKNDISSLMPLLPEILTALLELAPGVVMEIGE